MEISDRRRILAANPASWRTWEVLRKKRDAVPESSFRRYFMNQRAATGESAWLPAGAWQRCRGDYEIEDGEPIFAGLDVGGSRAATALVWVTEDLRVGCKVWEGEECLPFTAADASPRRSTCTPLDAGACARSWGWSPARSFATSSGGSFNTIPNWPRRSRRSRSARCRRRQTRCAAASASSRSSAELLLRDDLRLLVLTGAGGSGKTRLALEAARATAGAFANGSVFVGLAALRDPTLVIAAIAEACGVRKVSGEEHAVALTTALSSRELLLLIDNVEHLQAAAPSFVELLARAPRIKLLVTSRTVLHLSGERVYPVQPLTIEAASALFCERAREVDPRFDPEAIDAQAVGRICERLDGLPLAIELAAARTSLLSPAQLLARLDPRLPMLAGGLRDLPARQQTLRATIEWSYDLLSRTQRRLFRRLAVFAGSFDLTAAERVCDAELDTLGSLVDHNLVRRSSNGRLAMLATIREFALEALERSGETDAVRDRHAQFCLELARSADLSETAEGEPRHDLVTAEQDNIRAALGWTLDSDKVQLGVELATALELFWVMTSPLEGLRWLERLSAQAPYLPPETRARMLHAQAMATEAHGDFAGAETLYEQSLAAYRAIGDEREIAGVLHGLAARARERGDLPRARELANQSLDKHRAAGNVKGECIALEILGAVECDAGDSGVGIELLQRAAAMAGDAHFAWWQGHCLGELCERALELGRIAEAETWGRESLTLLHQVGDRRKTLLVLASLARAAAENGRFAEAGRLWGAFEAEEARSPLSWWQLAPEQRYSREFYTAPVLAHSSPDFDRGRDEGHRLSLDTAISYALEPNHTP